MLCQNCGTREATTHIKRISNGEAIQLHLCTSCAERLGYADNFSGSGFNISELLGNFFPDASWTSDDSEVEHCPTCGFTFEDIVSSGMMGCADCYDTFYEKLKPSLSRIHGRASHVGKLGTGSARKRKAALPDNAGRIQALEQEMQQAIQTQNFERAAEIRDTLKTLKGGATQ